MENGSRDESGNQRVVRENGAPNHRDSFKRRKISNGLDAAIRQLYNPPISRVTLLDLFDNRASFASITAWRFGWNAPPHWAADLLKAKLRTRAEQLLRCESTITPRKGSHGWRGSENLAVWRERKARERAAKEKAAEIAALHRAPENES